MVLKNLNIKMKKSKLTAVPILRILRSLAEPGGSLRNRVTDHQRSKRSSSAYCNTGSFSDDPTGYAGSTAETISELVFSKSFINYKRKVSFAGLNTLSNTQKSYSYQRHGFISNPNIASLFEPLRQRCDLQKNSFVTVSQSSTKEHQKNPTSFFDALCIIRDLNVSQTRNIHKLINLCMVDGKKTKSNKIILNTLYILGKKHDDVLEIFIKAVDNVKPILEVRKIRISGSTQLVPSIIARKRQYSLALRWIVEAAKKRRDTKKNMSLDQCLVAELIDAYKNVGTVRKKKDDLHKLAESNRGFAHYRWW